MSKLFWLIFVNQLSIVCIVSTYKPTPAVERTDDILRRYGYHVDVHTVTTDDGYKLVVFRVLTNRVGIEPIRNYPVLIQHCLFGSSADWVLAGHERSLPMQLVDNGYDVWLANSRGTPYSREHTDLSVEDNGYWDFTIHHLGVSDLPAIIDYMLKVTGKKYIHHIGNSMSTSSFYIMASEKPHYQSLIKSHISLGPVTKLGNTKSSFKNFAPYGEALNNLFQSTSKGEILGEDSYLRRFIKFLCKTAVIKSLICLQHIVFASFGYDLVHFDSDLVSVIFDHFPVSTSSKLFLHMSQFLTTDRFAQFDYGPDRNQEIYHSRKPPSYDLKKINVPITLFYATNDIMSCPKDVHRLIKRLPNLVNIIRIDDKHFNHVDFLWSKVVKEVVNEPIMEILAETDNPEWIKKDEPNIIIKTVTPAPDPYMLSTLKTITNVFSANYRS